MLFFLLSFVHSASTEFGQFFSICFVTTWLFPFNDSRSEWFLWGFQAGTSAQGGAWDTWIHERKRRRCDGRLKMDMVPKPWRLLCRGEFYWHPDGIFHVGRIRNNACVLLFENHLAICLATHDPLREVWADLTPERFIMIFIYSPSFVRSNDRPGRWWAVYFIEGIPEHLWLGKFPPADHIHIYHFLWGDIFSTMQNWGIWYWWRFLKVS